MFCAECGNEIMAGTTSCNQCGARTSSASPSQAAERIRSRSRDAFRVVKTIVANPVGGLSTAYQSLEKRQALEVGLLFGAVSEICVVVGLYLFLPRWAGTPDFGEIVKILILGVVPFAAIAGASFAARKIFRAPGGSIESDVFIGGISLLPQSLVVLLAGILGYANHEVVAIAAVFALSYTILILHAGCVRISGISEAGAAPAVPMVILISAWLSKITFSAML